MTHQATPQPPEAAAGLAPLPIYNRPGLAEIRFRVGAHSAFLRAMLERLAGLALEEPFSETDAAGAVFGVDRIYPFRGQRRRRRDTLESLDPADPRAPRVLFEGAWGPLETVRPGLTTRSPDDPSIALLDAWAVVADVLTFYQERIANEGYLRTATERRSVLELARLIGYALRPGVAATAYLAYTIEEKFAETAVIEPGAASRSVPNPGEQPQTFETVERLQARAQWNTLKPRLTRPQEFARILASRIIYFKGVTTNLKPNDPLLARLKSNAGGEVFRIVTVEPDPKHERTKVTVIPWDTRWEPPADPAGAAYAAALGALLRRAADEATARGYGIPLNGETARRLRAEFERLAADVAGVNTVAAADALVARAAPGFTGTLAAAARGGFRRVRPWLADSLNEWQRLADEFGAQGPLALAAAAAVAGNGGEDGAAAGPDPLKSVLAGLSIPPSQPPANAARLTRSAAAAFAPKSDAGNRALAALRPELSEQVATALSKVTVAAPNELEVYALRLKTGVYGNAALPRPALDAQGRPVGTEDWPLNPAAFSAQVTPPRRLDDDNDNAYTVVVRLAEGGRTFAGQVALTAAEPAAALDFDDDTSVKIELEAGDDSPQVTIMLVNTNRSLKIKFVNASVVDVTATAQDGAAQTLQVRRRQTATRMTAERRLRARYAVVEDRELETQYAEVSVEDEAFLVAEPLNEIHLDGVYEQAAPGGWAVVTGRAPKRPTVVASITAAQSVGRDSFNFPAKVTALTLDKDWLTDERWLADIRATVVLTQSELLELAEEPIPDPICGGDQWIELDGVYSELQAGRWVIVAGERADILDAAGKPVAGLKSRELVMLAEAQHDVYRGQTEGAQPSERVANKRSAERAGDGNHTFIRFAAPLQYCYRREDVTVYGNVVKASHGETTDEPLGSGDAGKAFQAFTLRRPPLTYVSAANPAGVKSTLDVFVNDVRWREVDSILDLTPRDRVYLTRTGDDGKTTVIFGDGQQGARPPTGVENIRSRYRSGIGKPGNVKAEQISQLQTRPLGVKSVINPMRASGGADPESRDQARRNAPLAVLALDRLVSTQDYADFARTFAGIGKASAGRMSDGRRQVVHVTIAGADDIPIDPASDLYRNLTLALREYGDPALPVRVDTRELILLVLQARVGIAADREWETVAAAARAKLLAAFSFEQRELGQDALLSHVLSVLHAVPGVTFVDVDVFGGIAETVTDAAQGLRIRRLRTPEELNAAGQALASDAGQPQGRVPVDLAAFADGALRPAQLALFAPAAPDTLILNQMP